MVGRTLARYFGLRFLSATLIVFVGVFVLVVLVDYVEMMRRSANEPNVSAWIAAKISFFRVPQITERIMPFAVLIGAMASYLALSRRLELVIARAAGVSAWQFMAPALVVALGLGVVATTIYNPIAAMLQEQSKRLEDEVFGGSRQSGLQVSGTGLWVRQRSVDGQSIINAATSSDQGLKLGGVTAFTFDPAGRFLERIEAKGAAMQPGFWRLTEVRVYASNVPPMKRDEYLLKTNLS